MKARIFEVGPRDGLQNESQPLSVADRVELIRLLVAAGHQDIECGAFVRADRIPQMAATEDVYKALMPIENTKQGPRFWTLVPNRKGFEKALELKVKHIAVFTAASDSFNLKNINTTVDGSFEHFREFLPKAKKQKLRVRGYVSTCFGCPYEGEVKPRAVLNVAERLLKLGVDEISIGDTIGVANPKQVKALAQQLFKLVGPKRLALHFHDTRATAIANVLEGLEQGVRIFDASLGGLGGCPYAPGASGNLATDDLLYMLSGMGVETGIDLDLHTRASHFAEQKLAKSLPSRYLKAGPFKPQGKVTPPTHS